MDTAPFTFWDSTRQDFQHPTAAEKQWIISIFSATRLTIVWPEIFIKTPSPPIHLPLTVACVPCLFVPPGHLTSHLSTSMDYCNPRLPDPVPMQFHFGKWARPSKQQYEAVFRELSTIMGIRSVNFVDSDNRRTQSRRWTGVQKEIAPGESCPGISRYTITIQCHLGPEGPRTREGD